MIRLLKYELQRKWKMSVGILGLYFLVYFGFLLKFNGEIKETIGSMNMMSFDLDLLISAYGFRIIFFIMLGSGLVFASIIGAVNNLRIEAKESSRDLYFSVPMTAYTKIGSKVIVSMVEIFAAGIIGFVSVIKAFEFLTKFDIWDDVMKAITSLPFDMLMFVIISQILEVAMMILVVYLSFAIFRTFFSQVKFGGIITFIIYVFLNYLLIRFVGELLTSIEETTITDMTIWLMLFGYGLFVTAIFGLVGFLFEKRVSFD